MRHRGIDIFAHPNDKMAVGHDAIKGVDWLTLLCDAFVERLGEEPKIRKALSQAVEVMRVPNGLLLKAGPQPRLGDTNRARLLARSDYKEVYQVVAPLAEPGYDRAPALLAGDGESYKQNTLAWRRRFANG